MPARSDVTLVRVSRSVAIRLDGGAGALHLSSRDRKIRATDTLLTDALNRAGVPENYSAEKFRLLSARRLAIALCRPYVYVVAMRAAGFVFQRGSRTTVAHAQEWLSAHPDFWSSIDAPVRSDVVAN